VREIALAPELPVGMFYLAECGGEWSFWKRRKRIDVQYTDWCGNLMEPPDTHNLIWGPSDYRFFVVPTEQSAAILMAARHMDKEAWEQFCSRIVERQVT
jgi:hypothetical protein